MLFTPDATPEKQYLLWSPTNPMQQPFAGTGAFAAATALATPVLPQQFARFVNPNLYRKWAVHSLDVRRIWESTSGNLCDVFSTGLPCDPSQSTNFNSAPGYDFGALTGADITDWLTMNPRSFVTGLGSTNGANDKVVSNSHYKTCNLVGIKPAEVYDHMCGCVLDNGTYEMLNGGNNGQTQYNAWFCDGVLAKYRDASIGQDGTVSDNWAMSATSTPVYFTLEVVYHCIAFNELGNDNLVPEPTGGEDVMQDDVMNETDDDEGVSFNSQELISSLQSLAMSKRTKVATSK
jgi:hypothetical protein